MRKYKLRELLTIKNGCDYRHLSTGSVPVYGSGGFMCFVNQAMSNKPSILLPRKGTLNNIMFIDKPFWTVDTMYWSEIKEDIVEPYYLYNYLKVLKFDGIRTGSTLPSMTSSAYYDIPVILPDYNKQTRVANILKLLNNKIELNNKINQELEQMAKTLYEYWFVQFDFPDEKGRPYKSANGKMVYNEVLKREIPVGWEVGTFSDITTTQAGYAFKSSEWRKNGHPVLTIKAIENNSINMSETSYIENYQEKYMKYSVSNGNIVLAMTGNTIGKIGIIASDIKNILINQRVCVYKTDYKNLAYLYFNLLSDGIQKKIWQIAQNSSQPNVSEEQLNSLSIVLPPKDLLNRYNKISSFSFEQIVNNNIENQQLSKLRDFLLPLLMNGQVSVQV